MVAVPTPVPATYDGGRISTAVDISAELALIGWDTTNFSLAAPVIEALSGVRRCVGFDVELMWKANVAALGDPSTWNTYYVRTDGSNSNNGSSDAQAFATLDKAITSANTAGVPTRVFVKAGYYNRSANFSGSGGTTQPTVAMTFYAYAGRAVCSAAESGANLAWAADGTNAWVSSGTRSNVLRVMDLLNKDGFGHYVQLTQVADLAACARTPNSWAQVSGAVKVNRTDGLAASDTNTRVLMTIPNFQQAFTAQKPFYFGGQYDGDGFDFEGGSTGCLYQSYNNANQVPAAKGMTAAKNCTFRYAGETGGIGQNGVTVQSIHGLLAFQGCDASKNAADGFNLHNAAGIGAVSALLTVNCTGFDAGQKRTSLSNNFWTLHEDCRGIDICGNGGVGRGTSIHIIDTAKALVLGSTLGGSLGDIVNGGTAGPCELRTENSATLYARLVTARPPCTSNDAARAIGTSSILTRDCVLAGMKRIDTPGSGAIGTY